MPCCRLVSPVNGKVGLLLYLAVKLPFGMKRLLCGTALFLFILSSCKDEYTICTLAKEVNFTSAFYRHVGANDVAVSAPVLSVFALNAPTSIYNRQANASSFLLPLNPAADSARYVIIVDDNTTSDTLTVVYTSQSTILSPECGSVITNNISRLYSTTHTIDSVKIISNAVSTTSMQNARIYF